MEDLSTNPYSPVTVKIVMKTKCLLFCYCAVLSVNKCLKREQMTTVSYIVMWRNMSVLQNGRILSQF